MTQPAASSSSLPATADLLAAEVVALFTQAEQRLIDAITRVTQHGFRDTAASAQLVMLAQMRQIARRIATELRLQATPLARQITLLAAADGNRAALAALARAVAGDADLAALYLTDLPVSGSALAAANAIALDLEHALDTTTAGILRYADDAYRAAIAEAATRLVLGREALTPVTAQSVAWTQLLARGVTGYTGQDGRRWNLASYVEMATRTAVQRAYNEAHLARMRAVGIDYFTVPHDGHPCPLCRPWEGAILAVTGTGRVSALSATGGQRVRFTVTATIAEAKAAGLWHPNCRHTLQPYLPGVTKVTPPVPWTAADQARYTATQRLRELERRVRAARRQEAGALDDLQRRRAARRARLTQAEIRAHVAATGLVRRPRRERANLGHGGV